MCHHTAAAKAVQHWRFQPGNINGTKQAMRVKVPIRFRLQ
ncbi:MAG: hypothetical protein GXP59_06970 [Deltaproteobacteria bacterium]|nr:hypothetical protein [Deltaproteobacteria bacterium]